MDTGYRGTGVQGMQDRGGAAEGSECVRTETGMVRGRDSGSGGWLRRVNPAEVWGMWGLLRCGEDIWELGGCEARAEQLGTEELQGRAGEDTGKEMGRECKCLA